jgi:hypothetical protein
MIESFMRACRLKSSAALMYSIIDDREPTRDGGVNLLTVGAADILPIQHKLNSTELRNKLQYVGCA